MDGKSPLTSRLAGSLATSLFALTVIGSPVAAQSDAIDPAAYEILQRAKAKYLARIQDVDDYTLVQTINGTESTLYFEKKLVDGVPTFFLIPPHEYQGGAQGAPAQPDQGGLASRLGLQDPRQRLAQGGMDALQNQLMEDAGPVQMMDPRTIDRFSEVARLVGTETVDGRDCYVLEATEIANLDLGGGNDGEVELQTIRLWLDKQELVARRTLVEAEVDVDGFSGPLEIETAYGDFRQIDTMYEPFRQTTEMSGMGAMMGSMSEEDRKEMEEGLKQLEDMDKMLAQLPAAQRRMVEARMGSQMEKARQMAGGGLESAFENFDLEMTTEDLLVNEGPPTPFGKWTITVVGMGFNETLNGFGAQVAPGRPWVLVLGVAGAGGRMLVNVQMNGPNALPQEAGSARGDGYMQLTRSEGLSSTDGTFNTKQIAPDMAEVTIESVRGKRIRGSFRFSAPGRVTQPRTLGPLVRVGSVTVSGTFDAVLCQIMPEDGDFSEINPRMSMCALEIPEN